MPSNKQLKLHAHILNVRILMRGRFGSSLNVQNIDRDIDVFIQQLVNRNVNCHLCSFSNCFVYRTEIAKWSKMA